ASGKPFVRYWLHNGYINIDNQKMSKSLGNFFTVRDISQEFDLEVVRLFMLSAHYRNPVNFSKELLEQAQSALERLYNAKNNLEYLLKDATDCTPTEEENKFLVSLPEFVADFERAMDDDINTADAIGVIFDLVREVNIEVKTGQSAVTIRRALDTLLKLTDILGLLSKQKGKLEEEIEELIIKREQARKDKNWALADSIRDVLKEQDIVLEDTPQGVRWKRI
ncbi:MAG: class I tRNA ligase family protein, partial [Clostridiales bacterium]|nr:class I tRNA ligase family protein [Clostridiales bacterium]